jgi:hypothetical protein
MKRAFPIEMLYFKLTLKKILENEIKIELISLKLGIVEDSSIVRHTL